MGRTAKGKGFLFFFVVLSARADKEGFQIFVRGWGDEGRQSEAIADPKEPREGDGLGLWRRARVAVGMIAAGIWRIGMVLARADYDRHPRRCSASIFDRPKLLVLSWEEFVFNETNDS